MIKSKKNKKNNGNNNYESVPRQLVSSGNFKYLDTGISADIPATTTGAVVIPSLNIVPTGTDAKTRTGKRIRIFKIDYRVQLTRGTENNNTVTACSSSLCLVKDNATKGSTPTFDTVFEASAINAFINGTNSTRFKILKRWDTTINTIVYWNSNTNQANCMAKTVVSQGTLSCNVPVLYTATGTTGAVAQTIENCLLVTFIGDNTSTTLVMAGTAFRIYYMDEI